jgi:membrane-associated phospholipid phosphatase
LLAAGDVRTGAPRDGLGFLSGHTTVAFAAAAAVSAEVARSDLARRHPAAVGAVAPLLYGGAALVGVSRMYHDAHWASDVVAAAGVGTLAGRAIVRLQHATPRGPGERRIERWLLPTTVAPVAGGIVIGWSGTFR